MHRAGACLAVMGLVLLALPGVASAAPEVTFKAKAVPMTGYAETGNLLNAGTAVEAEYSISGTEYGGFPAPLIGVNFYLPNGAKIHPAGFPTCATQVVAVEKEPSKCPAGSKAGPVGKVLGVVAFGGTRVPEEATLRILLRTRRRPELLHVRSQPGHPGNRLHSQIHDLTSSGGKGPELIARSRSSKRSRARLTHPLRRSPSRSAPPSARRAGTTRRTSTTAWCRLSAPRAASRSRHSSRSPASAG